MAWRLGVGGVEERGDAFGELGVGEPCDEMAEAGQGGQQCHDPGLTEAEPGAVVALVDGGPGHLQEGGHVGGGVCGCGFGVAQTPVGGLANCPEGMPVLGADAPADPEVAGVADHRLGAQRPSLL